MSRFAQLLTGAAWANHEHVFSMSVTLTEGTTSTTTPAVLHKIIATYREINGDTKQVLTRRCRFTQLSQVRHDAIVTISGEDWQIEAIHSAIASGVEVTLIRTLITEQARSNYRK